MKKTRRQGFTLIELLTVIAIIGILASLTAVVLPRALERAKVTRVKNAMNQIQTSLVQYFADHNSYPPRYGYMLSNPGNQQVRPYPVALGFYDNPDLYDEFSESHDTNRDGNLSLLEFSPIGDRNQATGQVTFPTEVYNGNNMAGQVELQMQSAPRPFVYVPVNARQLAIVNRYWVERNDLLAETWDGADPLLSLLEFPSESYDKYVLISVGPAGSTSGVLSNPTGGNFDLSGYSLAQVYQILGLRAYWLATRDADGNGVLDFDYEARRTGASDAVLPDGTRGYGPLIFTSQ
jgi:prepilin-type N-terminal cleavage/methylation domain-containing protein